MQPAERLAITQAAGKQPGRVATNIEQAAIRAGYYALEEDWRLVTSGRFDLERALTLISNSGPTRTGAEVSTTLDRYADEISQRLTGDRAFDVGLSIISDVLGQKHALRGNANDYYAPENSYLADVLRTGLGIPISLCSIAILIGRRLELPVAGIGAPGHFLGFYGDVDLKIGHFFDPFAGFARLTAGKLQALLSQYVTADQPIALKPVSDRELVARALRNLAGCYAKHNQPEHIRNLNRWNLLLAA